MLRLRNLSRSLRKALFEPRYALRVLWKRLVSYGTYRLRKGYSAYPETVSLFLTYRCNLRCKMCGQWGEDGWARLLSRDDLEHELPHETLTSLIEDLSKFKPTITLFGGEPLMSKNWEWLVRSIKTHRMRVNMITNGTLLAQHVEKVVDSGVDELIFSLDGPEEVHDEMRSGKGIFQRAINAFSSLNEYKKKVGKKTPRVNISTTIFETNYRRLDEVVAIAESIGADTITFHHLIFLSMGICKKNSQVLRDEFGMDCMDWTGFARETLPNIDIEYLLDKLHDLSSRKSSVSISIYPNLTDEEVRRYYTSFEFTPQSYTKRCVSPWMTVYIFPNGDVKPCLDISYVTGNIIHERFSTIWNNEKYRNYRSVLKKRGCFPACTRCTEFYRS